MSRQELEVWAAAQNDKRRRLGLARDTAVVTAAPRYHFATNDYLGLARDPQLLAQVDPHQVQQGVAASRLVAGTTAAHLECEEQVARIVGTTSALVLGSGYHANIACLQALLQRGDTVVADRFVHASMLDGVTLSGARLVRFKHNDCADLRRCLQQARQIDDRSRILILTESLFSINGDLAPLQEIVEVAEQYRAPIVLDEAHAFGPFGSRGGGLAEELGLTERIAVITGSFGKAVGTFGGFIACSEALRTHFVGSARAFIYSTGLPLPLMLATKNALERIESGAVNRSLLFDLACEFRRQLQIALPHLPQIAGRTSYVAPVYISGNESVCRVSQRLATEGIFVYPMRSPTVPRGSECLRFSITLHHTQESLRYTVERLHAALSAEGLC